ncbi:MAG: hypothetical protein ABIP38_07550, partial [Steroidobacteraceae bacterium]
PALSAELHTQFASGLFGSLWASTSRPRAADDTSVELGATIGFALVVDDRWAARLGYSHYESPGSSRPGFYQYDEFSAELRFRDRLFLGASYSPNTSRYAPVYGPVWNRGASTFEASFQQPLADGLQGNLGIGFYDLSALFGEGYWYGSVGVGWSWRRWSLDLSWVVPDATARRLSYVGAADKRFLGSASFAF